MLLWCFMSTAVGYTFFYTTPFLVYFHNTTFSTKDSMFYDEEVFPNGQMGITIPNICLHDTNTLKYQKKNPKISAVYQVKVRK